MRARASRGAASRGVESLGDAGPWDAEGGPRAFDYSRSTVGAQSELSRSYSRSTVGAGFSHANRIAREYLTFFIHNMGFGRNPLLHILCKKPAATVLRL